jgi:hypothetical protein
MDILSFKVNMAGSDSLDCSIPSKYDFISIYNAGSEYAVKVLLNGQKIYDLPSAFIGSLPIGALQQGAGSNTITIQWTDISGGGLPDFLQLIYSEEQIVTSAISSLSAMNNYMQLALYPAKGDIISASAINAPMAIHVGSDGQVLTANSAAGGGMDWETIDLTPIDLNIIDLAINLETLKGAILTGVVANIFVETFQALTDITLSHGTYDAVNKKVYLS